jgi:GNAT superfamily N-acetyltransferase
MEITLSQPCPIKSHHDIEQFDSRNQELNQWLKVRALSNELKRASRTFVVCEGNNIVRGYYSLAAGSVSHVEAIRHVRQNMPDPVPIMILGRLAVDYRLQGQGIGTALLRDAVLRTLQAAEIAGIKAILVHAIDEQAIHFYTERGFKASCINNMTLMLPLEDVYKHISKNGRF